VPVQPGGPGSISSAVAQMIVRSQESVVQVRNGGRGGAGVVWDKSGLVLTNDHVVGGRRDARVTLRDGRTFGAEVARRARDLDLALLRLRDAPGGLPAAPVGDSDALRVGELVYAIGHPWGRLGAVTAGVVSGSLVAAGPGGRLPRSRARYVRSDLALAPGNSGGPLLNARGEVVGINAMISGRAAFSIPSNAASAWLAGSGDRRPRLGVGLVPAALPASARRADRGVPERGFVISAVEKGSPAERAGLLIGDVLLGVGDGPTYEAGSVPEAVASAGEAVRLRAMRGGEVFSLDVKLEVPGRAA
jgi:serine protease Do